MYITGNEGPENEPNGSQVFDPRTFISYRVLFYSPNIEVFMNWTVVKFVVVTVVVTVVQMTYRMLEGRVRVLSPRTVSMVHIGVR